jgi:hypothetical protein
VGSHTERASTRARRAGLLVASGPGIAANATHGTRSILGVAPTVLALLGPAAPPLSGAPEPHRPGVFLEPGGAGSSAEVEERLRDLGYTE